MNRTHTEHDVLVQEAMRAASEQALLRARTMTHRVSNRMAVALSTLACLIAAYDLAVLVVNMPA